MKDLLRALLAGWGAKKAGFGCFGTVIVFIILYWILGKFMQKKMLENFSSIFFI